MKKLINNKKSEVKKLSLIVLFNFLLVLIGILLVLASTFVDNSQNNFNSGTYNWTFYNSSGFVQLNSSRLNGSYMSQIFNAGGLSRWNNISWLQGGYYQQELPNNQAVENRLGGANMTGNVLLMHFNNDSSFGENSTWVYDFSGMGNKSLEKINLNIVLSNILIGLFNRIRW